MAELTYEGILQDFVRRNPVVESAAVITAQGICAASVLKPGIEEETLAALSAAISALGSNVLNELKGGRMREVYIRGEGRMIMILEAGEETLLFLVTSEDARLGLILNEAKRAARQIEEVEAFAPANIDLQQFFGEWKEEELMRFIEDFALSEEDQDLFGEEGEGK